MESNTWCPHLSAAMILSGSAVKVKGWVLVVLDEEAVDCRLTVGDGVEDAPLETALRQFGEEALDRVEP